ncbi:GAF domain-containing sensor histidine kinase [Thermocoleostomius sinensis]|uniref:histidine kinase n=1 Tax=Thermocoleostomius sinensis A174 TaxID=2016057 RepID=A0A9E8Z7Z7_9CYAN|nr:ATP-binding protein [Thermocoleostomius sinensis]WAL58153.1 ATP-binding protein [Thermocoleostomius sinensis A174]
MPASSEFITLCRSQVTLLTQGLGAALSIIYLTDELTDATDAKLIPIVAYPDAVTDWGDDRIFSLLSQGRAPASSRLLLADSSSSAITPISWPIPSESDSPLPPLQAAEMALLRQQQMVLPLMHQDVVMGLLVTARADRAWNDSEQAQIEKIAETIAIACVLDQRSQWFAQDRHQQELLQEQKHDLFDNLVHQFRNPLTALRTFGKLLIKRLQPTDSNRSIAEGIVRESDRLQELLQQFDVVIDLDEQGLRRLLAPTAQENDQLDTELDAENLDAEISAELESETNSSTQPVTANALPRVVAREFDALDARLFGTTVSKSTSPALLPGSNVLVGRSMQLAPHSVTEVLTPLLESASAIAQDRQLILQTEIPSNLPFILIDLNFLREVLTNLIDNALKYTPSGGLIYVGVYASIPPKEAEHKQPLQETPSQQTIVIADTGPGIPPQDLEHLFERHYRGVQSQTDIPGTGLGLAIARELIQQMHGTIKIFSPAQSSGFQLPSAPVAAQNLPGTAVVVQLPEV